MPLPLIPIAAVGAGALLLAQLRRPAAPAAPPAPPPPAVTPLPPPPPPQRMTEKQGGEALAGGIGSLAGALMGATGASAGLAAGAVAVTVLHSQVGYMLTGDEVGRITGAVLGVTGNSINAGRAVGKQLTAGLGAESGSAVDVAAQSAAAYALGTASLFGLGAFLSSLSLAFPYFFAVWGVAAIIGDYAALAYGPAGARKDMQGAWTMIRDNAMIALRSDPKNTAKTQTELMRLACAFADGYVWQGNRIKHRAVMKKPRGVLGVTDQEHCRFFRDRGAFVGSCIIGAGELYETWEPYTHSSEFLNTYVPREELKEETRSTPVVQVVPPPLNFIIPIPGVPPKQINTLFDPVARAVIEIGKKAANLAAFKSWMVQTWGVMQTSLSHAAYGRNAGYFEGEFESTGSSDSVVLSYAGVRWLWTFPKDGAAPKLVVLEPASVPTVDATAPVGPPPQTFAQAPTFGQAPPAPPPAPPFDPTFGQFGQAAPTPTGSTRPGITGLPILF